MGTSIQSNALLINMSIKIATLMDEKPIDLDTAAIHIAQTVNCPANYTISESRK